MIKDNLSLLKGEIEPPIHSKLNEILEKIEQVKTHISEIEHEVKKDRKEFPKLIEDNSKKLLQQLNTFTAKYGLLTKNVFVIYYD